METLILPAAESDAGVMALLYVSSWRSAYTGIVPDDYLKLKLSGAEEKFKHLLAESPLGHYLILSGGTPAGILSAGELADQYELRGLYIHPEFQRCGVGRSAVEFVFALGRARGFSRVCVRVLEANTGARRFYRRCGFAESGFAGFYDGRKDMLCKWMIADISGKGKSIA